MIQRFLSLLRGQAPKPAALLKLEGPRSPQWPAVRAQHLLKEPACVACGGTKKLQVHHIQPFHLHPELELLDSNLITLCEFPSRNCHYCLGHLWDWMQGNVNVRMDATHLAEEKRGLQTG